MSNNSASDENIFTLLSLKFHFVHNMYIFIEFVLVKNCRGCDEWLALDLKGCVWIKRFDIVFLCLVLV